MPYFAPKPTKPWATWLEIILLRVVFPPILLWDLLRVVFNLVFGRLVGWAVLGTDKIPGDNLYVFGQDNTESSEETLRFELVKKSDNDNATSKAKLGPLSQRQFLTEEKLDELTNEIRQLLLTHQDKIISFQAYLWGYGSIIGRLIYQKLPDGLKNRFIYSDACDYVFYHDENQEPKRGELGVYFVRDEDQRVIAIKTKKRNLQDEVEDVETYTKEKDERFNYKVFTEVLNCIESGKTLDSLDYLSPIQQ